MPKFERGPKKPKIDTLEDIIKLRTKDALRRVKEELKPLREQEKLACQPCKDAKAQTKMKREEIKAIKEDKSGDIAWGSKNYIARMSGNVKERLLKFESSVK